MCELQYLRKLYNLQPHYQRRMGWNSPPRTIITNKSNEEIMVKTFVYYVYQPCVHYSI